MGETVLFCALKRTVLPGEISLSKMKLFVAVAALIASAAAIPVEDPEVVAAKDAHMKEYEAVAKRVPVEVSYLPDTPDVVEARESFKKVFSEGVIPNAYMADTAEVAEAKEAFATVYKAVEDGDAMAIAPKAEVPEVEAVKPVVYAMPSYYNHVAAYPYYANRVAAYAYPTVYNYNYVPYYRF